MPVALPRFALSEIRSRSQPATYVDKVSAPTEKLRLGLHPTHSIHQLRAPRRIFDPGVEVAQCPGRTLDSKQAFHDQPRLFRFFPQLRRSMEVRGGKPSWSPARVAMLPISEVTGHDGLEIVVGQKTVEEPVDGRGEA